MGDRPTYRWWILLILFVVILGMWLLTWYVVAQSLGLKSWAERGQFGDMFGGLNALFSGFAFAGLLYAIYLQTKELSLQRQELQDTREELRRTADAQERTERALSEQARVAAITAMLQAETAIMRSFPSLTAGGAQDSLQRIRTLQRELERVMGMKLPPATF